MLDGKADAVPVPVGVMVLFPCPMLVTGSPEVIVPLDDTVAPDEAEEAGDVIVAKVLPSKSEGTVGLGAASSPVRLRWDPDSVITDTDELLWPAARPASHTSERRAPFMIVTGVGHSPTLFRRRFQETRVRSSVKAVWATVQLCREKKMKNEELANESGGCTAPFQRFFSG